MFYLGSRRILQEIAREGVSNANPMIKKTPDLHVPRSDEIYATCEQAMKQALTTLIGGNVIESSTSKGS